MAFLYPQTALIVSFYQEQLIILKINILIYNHCDF